MAEDPVLSGETSILSERGSPLLLVQGKQNRPDQAPFRERIEGRSATACPEQPVFTMASKRKKPPDPCAVKCRGLRGMMKNTYKCPEPALCGICL